MLESTSEKVYITIILRAKISNEPIGNGFGRIFRLIDRGRMRAINIIYNIMPELISANIAQVAGGNH